MSACIAAVCRALSDRRLGHAEVPARNGACRHAVPRAPRAAQGRLKRVPDHGTKKIEAVNDFVIKFANVNGSGSASANTLFAKSIMRMGVPISPRNIFPSNIQGLPTWYEVRVSQQGWLGRRGGVDLMVAMNPQTWDTDLAEIEPGGYLFYDSTKPLPQSKFRDDITVIGMPLTAICNDAYTDARERQLFKNIIYVGALAALLEIDPDVIAALIGEQYRGKEKLLQPNVHALHMGYAYARERLGGPIGLRVVRSNAVGDKIFIEGNSAAALGCVYGGATVAAWYPLTPSSSMAEAFSKHCKKFRTDPEGGRARHAIIQAEDELASIGIVIGAGWKRRTRVHRDFRPRHLAHAGVHRPRVLRGDPRSAIRRAARRPVDRDAHAHAAVRLARVRVRVARRPRSTRCCSRRTEGSLRVRRRGVRPRRPAADARFRAVGPRYRHERAPL